MFTLKFRNGSLYQVSFQHEPPAPEYRFLRGWLDENGDKHNVYVYIPRHKRHARATWVTLHIDGEFAYEQVSVCSPLDNFDKKRGRKASLEKLLALVSMQEFGKDEEQAREWRKAMWASYNEASRPKNKPAEPVLA